MPPAFCTVRNARVVTRSRTRSPSESESNVTCWRLGAKVRRVRRFEWDTLFPLDTLAPVSPHRHAIRSLLPDDPEGQALRALRLLAVAAPEVVDLAASGSLAQLAGPEGVAHRRVLETQHGG